MLVQPHAAADKHRLTEINTETRGDDLRAWDLGELEDLGAPGAALTLGLGDERGFAGAAVLAGEPVHGQAADRAALADKDTDASTGFDAPFAMSLCSISVIQDK